MSIGIQSFRTMLLGSVAALALVTAGVAAHPSSAAADRPDNSLRVESVGWCLGEVTSSAGQMGITPPDFGEFTGQNPGERQMSPMAGCARWIGQHVIRSFGPVR